MIKYLLWWKAITEGIFIENDEGNTMNKTTHKIAAVAPGSIAEELELKP